MFRVVTNAPQTDKEGISPFQALCTSLASRVGTGNIAGVAVALTLGGPGAIFWMWMVALVGMATAYSESTLAQLYKVHDKEGGGTGVYRGGPAFYIARGLGHALARRGLLGLPDLSLRPRLQRGAGELDRRRDGRRLRHAEARSPASRSRG